MKKLGLLVGVMMALVGALRAADAPRPNVVIFLADDLGYRDVGCYGAPDIKTPVIDGMAREGLRFTSFYTNGAECTPTRAALLTGRYQHRVGGLECAIGIGDVGRYDDADRLAKAGQLGLPVEHTSIARLLKDAGYATAICGKWHLGYRDQFSPNLHGFDHAFYALGGGMEYFYHVEDPPDYLPVLRLNGKPLTRNGYFTDMVADEAVKFVDEHAKEPFFLYVPFTAPHAPYQAPDEMQPKPLAADSTRWRQGSSPPEVYRAMIEREDEAIGRVLKAVDEKGLARNTMAVFLSDNGGTASARPMGLRGQKGTLFEGGIRVPCVVRWPERLSVRGRGQVCTVPAMTIDLSAAIVKAAGAKAPEKMPLDGVDLLGVAESGKAADRMMFWRHRRGEKTQKAVRDGDLKLVLVDDGKKKEEYLFDIVKDIKEETDLLPGRQADAERLKKAIAEWEVRVKANR